MSKDDKTKETNAGSAGKAENGWVRLPKNARLAILIGGIVLIAAAVALIAYAIYQSVGTGDQTADSLSEIKSRLEEPTPAAGTDVAETPDAPAAATLETADPAPAPPADPEPAQTPQFSVSDQPPGESFGYMIFDSILDDGKKREVAIVEGTTPEDLDKGAGHYIGFSYPGENGNTPIFGHRTTVFKNFDRLAVGDTIRVVTGWGTYVYEIAEMHVTEPMAPIMFGVYDEPVLTLVTCYPFVYPGHAPERYVVISRLVERLNETAE